MKKGIAYILVNRSNISSIVYITIFFMHTCFVTTCQWKNVTISVQLLFWTFYFNNIFIRALNLSILKFSSLSFYIKLIFVVVSIWRYNKLWIWKIVHNKKREWNQFLVFRISCSPQTTYAQFYWNIYIDLPPMVQFGMHNQIIKISCWGPAM